jgi:hypothetical protein
MQSVSRNVFASIFYLSIDFHISSLIRHKVIYIKTETFIGVGANLLLAARHPKKLDGLKYILIAILGQAKPYLHRGLH